MTSMVAVPDLNCIDGRTTKELSKYNDVRFLIKAFFSLLKLQHILYNPKATKSPDRFRVLGFELHDPEMRKPRNETTTEQKADDNKSGAQKAYALQRLELSNSSRADGIHVQMAVFV